uniref:Zinc-finger domain-containing protein n=1 Tax=Musa acuminata subsp. malaccensis TaxID=214687 RepID=A0A804JFK9_MUSAM
MGASGEKSAYERLRDARIQENKARLESLGLLRRAGELRAVISSSSSATGDRSGVKRKRKIRIVEGTPLRRSERLKSKQDDDDDADSSPPCSSDVIHQVRKRLFSDGRASKSRGSVYDPLLGICCHFCRQKKLCGEEDCRRCGDGNINQPCIGKTECSVCHSSNGVLCRACLKVRYGEEMEEVRAKKDWMCPHCIEEKGINPYWICNSSLCLKKRKMAPTGIAIYQAREQGYRSVAHLLMDRLKREAAQK